MARHQMYYQKNTMSVAASADGETLYIDGPPSGAKKSGKAAGFTVTEKKSGPMGSTLIRVEGNKAGIKKWLDKNFFEEGSDYKWNTAAVSMSHAVSAGDSHMQALVRKAQDHLDTVSSALQTVSSSPDYKAVKRSMQQAQAAMVSLQGVMSMLQTYAVD